MDKRVPGCGFFVAGRRRARQRDQSVNWPGIEGGESKDQTR
jgi:hypothetical protein